MLFRVLIVTLFLVDLRRRRQFLNLSVIVSLFAAAGGIIQCGYSHFNCGSGGATLLPRELGENL